MVAQSTAPLSETAPGQSGLFLLLSVTLPPAALDVLGHLVEERTIETPYGAVGPIGLREPAEGQSVWVEPYYGGPRRTDPRATIIAAAKLGLRQILAWDTGIALATSLQRGQVAVVADYIDWTHRCTDTFSGAHTSLEQIAGVVRRPAFCPRMTDILRRMLPDAVEVVYLAVDGPRRETAAEARMFRMWGADVAGQNLVPEVPLAQEAGFCFAGLVTIGELAADQAQPGAHGEVRASLGTALAALPDIIEQIAVPGECACAATLG